MPFSFGFDKVCAADLLRQHLLTLGFRHVVTNETVSLLPAVVNLILLEVPLAITEKGSEEMPSGNGWRVISEAEYEKGRKDRIDPRLAKLKQFKSKDN